MKKRKPIQLSANPDEDKEDDDVLFSFLEPI